MVSATFFFSGSFPHADDCDCCGCLLVVDGLFSLAKAFVIGEKWRILNHVQPNLEEKV
jgi:hypothetical protein